MIRLFKEMFILALGGLAFIYVLNPTAGADFLPDFLPFVGNLDEATATVILMNVAAYYGLDLRRMMQRREDSPQPNVRAVDAQYREVNRR